MRLFYLFIVLTFLSFFSVAFAQIPGALPLAGRTITPIYHCLDGGILMTVFPLNVPTAAWPFIEWNAAVSGPFTRPYGTFSLPTAPVLGNVIPWACLIFPFPPIFIPAQVMLWNGSAPPLVP